MKEDLLYLVDEKGSLKAVQLSATLWNRVESLVAPLLAQKDVVTTVQQQGPLNDFKTLMEYWDFTYPYSPAVTCPHCGAHTDDWRCEPQKDFILTNANLGGLLVFHCLHCGTTIRHKHFRDHVSYEHTTPVRS